MRRFKRIRLKSGYFTRKELYDFANNMIDKLVEDPRDKKAVWDADIENFIEDLLNK